MSRGNLLSVLVVCGVFGCGDPRPSTPTLPKTPRTTRTIDAGPARDAGVNQSEGIDPTWHGEVPEVCDGSNSIRLRYLVAADLSQVGPGAFLEFQNGAGYWLITGDCHYYVLGGSEFALNRLFVRDGDLTHDQAQAIGRRVHFGQLTDSILYPPPETVFHVGVERLELGDEIAVGCAGICVAPPEVRDAMTNASAVLVELAATGQSWQGPMRITVIYREVVGLPPSLDPLAIDWPLRVPIGDVSIDETETYTIRYTGTLIEDPDDLRALRALAPPVQQVDFWYVRDPTGKSFYELRIRDAIPLEDADGIIQRTWSGPTDESDGGL